jgi:pimeloyl-ACP methyl ester carboxylesterase
LSPELERRSVPIDGCRLSYLERAPGTDRGEAPVLILHGLVASAETFGKLIPELPEDRRVVVLDLPGAGFSERPPELPAGLAHTAALVLRFAEQVGLHRPVVLGHSHGGAIAFQMAATEPEFAQGLVLVCPAHPFSGREEWLVRFYLSATGRVFARLLPLLPARLYLAAFRRMPGRRGSVTLADVRPYHRSLRVRGTVAHLLRLLSTWRADMDALGARLREGAVRTPRLLIWGEVDPVVPASTALELLRFLPGAELVILGGVGHVPNEEAPLECGNAIREWLGRGKSGRVELAE